MRRHDLPAREPAPAQAPGDGPHQEAPARPLGLRPRTVARVGAPEPPDQEARPGHDLPLRAGPRCAGHSLERLPGGHLLGDLPREERGRGRHGAVPQGVLLPRRNRQPLHAGDPRLDARGWRAWLQPLAWLRSGVRQPGPDRRRHGGRRRVRDRPARHCLALEQVPQPRPRRRRAAHPAPERLQDRQPDRARPDQPRGVGEPLRRLWIQALRRRGLRSRRRAPADGGHAGDRPLRDPRDPAQGPRGGCHGLRPLADDHPAHAEGLDLPGRGGRPQAGGLLACPPGAPAGPRSPRPPGPAGAVAAQLPAGRAFR